MHARTVLDVDRVCRAPRARASVQAGRGRGQCVRCACIIGWTVGSVLLGLVPLKSELWCSPVGLVMESSILGLYRQHALFHSEPNLT